LRKQTATTIIAALAMALIIAVQAKAADCARPSRYRCDRRGDRRGSAVEQGDSVMFKTARTGTWETY